MQSARFDELYRQHYGYVARSLTRLGVDFSSIEDVAQDVFVVVHRRMSTYDPCLPFKPWLFGIVFNVVREERRRLRRRPTPHRLDREVPENDRGFDEVEASRTVRRLLARLSPEKRAVIILCDLDGATPTEAAAALGVSVEAVYTRLRRARAELGRMTDDRSRAALPIGASSPERCAHASGTSATVSWTTAAGVVITGAAAIATIVAAIALDAPAREPHPPARVTASIGGQSDEPPAPEPLPLSTPRQPTPTTVAPEPSNRGARAPRETAATRPPARADAPAPEEWTFIHEARVALREGNIARASSTLAEHRRHHPDGAMSEERERLAIEALARSGRMDDARTRATTFRRTYPGSIYGPELARLVR